MSVALNHETDHLIRLNLLRVFLGRNLHSEVLTQNYSGTLNFRV
jgi:hypothetical protein